MQIHQDRGYVVVFPYTSNKARSGVLNILKLLPSHSNANRDGTDAEFPFPLFFSSSASFKL